MRAARFGVWLMVWLISACGDDGPVPGDAGETGDASVDAPCVGDDCCTEHADCDNGDYCDGLERCVDAHCTPGQAVACDDDIACTTDRCDETQDRCVFSAADADEDGHADKTCLDAQGEPLGDDCDDDNADRFPGNVERCDPETSNASEDEDCDAHTFGEVDLDGDGAVDDRCVNVDADGVERRGYDCDDQNMARRRGQQEFCDQRDNDCDETVDEDPGVVAWYADEDEDGVGGGTPVIETCTLQPDLSLRSNDCDDTDAARRPGFPEFCDGVDNNCNDVIDERLTSCATSEVQTKQTIDECRNGLHDCAPEAVCTDLPEGFSCACAPGYMGDGLTCVDIDECATDNGGCASQYFTCVNNLGAAATCVDIDECATDNGGCASQYFTCVNNLGAAATCVDIDECATDNGGCDPQAACVNNVGAAATCGPCAAGYQGDGYTCTAIPRTCLDVLNAGTTVSGSYTIDPDGAGALAPFLAYCDLTHDGGGWTMIRRNSGGTNSSTEGLPDSTNNVHLSPARMMALAELSTQVHIRTAGVPGDSITSNAGSGPIVRLRQGLSMYDPLPNCDLDASPDWTGNSIRLTALRFSCCPEVTDYPNGVFHACNFGSGMHWKNNTTGWTSGGGSTLELYFR